jgi:hypothetical protein
MLAARDFFEKRIKDYVEALRGVGGVVQFTIEGSDGGTWWVDMDSGTVTRKKLPPNVIVRAYVRDFYAFVEGMMSVEDGLLTDRLHLAGDAERLMKLAAIFKNPPP